ncbi:MAG TPA: hypothetical protein VLT61_10210 [Anaeromyxobacteraceae bacterium]|nr:hypothetical protein [Anaeromyxobacteraceae bacterium]
MQAPPASPARTFSVGGALSRVPSTWARNAAPFTVVALLVQLPAFALAVGRRALYGPVTGPDLVQTIADNVLGLVTAGALTYGVLRALHGEKTSAGAMLAVGLRRFGRIFTTSLAVSVVVFAGSLALLIPGIVALAGLFVAVPAAVAEPGLGALVEAPRRSWELTKGRLFPVLGVVVVAFGVFTLAMTLVVVLLKLAVGMVPWPAGLALSRTCMAIAAGVLYSVPAVVYHDLRVEKEGVATEDLVKVFE